MSIFPRLPLHPCPFGPSLATFAGQPLRVPLGRAASFGCAARRPWGPSLTDARWAGHSWPSSGSVFPPFHSRGAVALGCATRRLFVPIFGRVLLALPLTCGRGPEDAGWLGHYWPSSAQLLPSFHVRGAAAPRMRDAQGICAHPWARLPCRGHCMENVRRAVWETH